MLRYLLFCFLVVAIMPLGVKAAQAGDEAESRYQENFGNEKLSPNTVVVKLYKYNFCPKNLTVKPGTTVRWINVDSRTSHSVWPKEAGIAESERFFPDEFFEIKFDDEGTYPYLCGPHWKQEGMVGTLTVAK